MKARFKKKVVLITGAGRGIGRAIASAMAEEQAAVIINYNRSHDEAFSLQQSLQGDGKTADIYQADVSDAGQTEKMIDDCVQKYGRIDILVNNAGINKDGLLSMMSPEDWKLVISTNLDSLYNTCKWVSRAMIAQKSGKIINISSISALKGLVGQTNYSASKGGMLSFTRALAFELARFNIQVNAVAPGFIDTEMTDQLSGQTEKILSKVPMGRFGTVDEVASGVLFLASGAADYITGQVLVIDGGIH